MADEIEKLNQTNFEARKRDIEIQIGNHRRTSRRTLWAAVLLAILVSVGSMVQLARQNRLFLHAHSDVDAVERLFKQWPEARILWAHSGFDRPEKVREMLRKHKNLWCDLAFRTDHASGGKVDPAWRAAFLEFPDRFMVGTDTPTPERWHYIAEHSRWVRTWLAELPREVAEKIAYRNGEAVFGKMLPPRKENQH
jgi:predicted TIM-barrel fold metal-dependent hydrolase